MINPEITTQNLHAALASAQGEFDQIRRDKSVTVTMKSGGKYSFSYAPLESILRAVTPALSKHGLALTQATKALESGKEFVETTLRHGSGEVLTNMIPIFVRDDGPQAYGSALTYARRYGVTLLLCISADDDDDGNAAEGNSAEVTRQPQPIQPKTNQKARDYAKRFHEAFEVGIDQAIIDLHAELQTDHDLYRETWGILPSGMRRQIKELIERSKAA
jgi:ERF superfamily protein